MTVALAATLIAGSAALGGAVLGRGIFAPRSNLLCPVIIRGDRGGSPRVALTFDDGPWPESTEAILEILGREGVRAAFFVIGAHARRWPGIVRAIDAAGHVVGNHSDSHLHWGARRHTPFWLNELDRASESIADAIGKRPALFRPPLGHKTWFMASAARARGYSVVTWTRRGFDGVPTTPRRIEQYAAAGAEGGDIIVLHDGMDPFRTRDPGVTVSALPGVLARLRQRGLETERLDRLIARPAYLEDARAASRRS